MSDVQFISILFTGICALSLLVLVVLAKNYQIDALRERLFSLRDEIFLYAYDQDLIGNPAYQNLRFILNGFLRYSHRLSFAQIYFLSLGRKYFGLKLSQPKEMIEWQSAVEALPLDQSESFRKFHSDALTLIVRHIMFRSPLVWIMLVATILNVLIVRGPQRLLDAVAQTLKPRMRPDILEIEAMKYAREVNRPIYAPT
jgi:hypothetical protein